VSVAATSEEGGSGASPTRNGTGVEGVSPGLFTLTVQSPSSFALLKAYAICVPETRMSFDALLGYALSSESRNVRVVLELNPVPKISIDMLLEDKGMTAGDT